MDKVYFPSPLYLHTISRLTAIICQIHVILDLDVLIIFTIKRTHIYKRKKEKRSKQQCKCILTFSSSQHAKRMKKKKKRTKGIELTVAIMTDIIKIVREFYGM